MDRTTGVSLFAVALLCLAGCDQEGITTITIRVDQGLNRRAEAMPVDGSQLGEDYFSEETTRSSDMKVTQEIRLNRRVKIVLIPIEPSKRKDAAP